MVNGVRQARGKMPKWGNTTCRTKAFGDKRGEVDGGCWRKRRRNGYPKLGFGGLRTVRGVVEVAQEQHRRHVGATGLQRRGSGGGTRRGHTQRPVDVGHGE